MLNKIMIVCAAITFSTQALADAPLRVLYMEVDKGQRLISRDNPTYQNIYDQTGRFLQKSNIRLMDSPDHNKSGKSSFKNAMRSLENIPRRKLNAIVTVSVRHKQKRQDAQIKDRIIAVAKVVDAQSLKILDTIQVQSPIAKFKKGDCRNTCRHQIMRKHAQKILPQFKKQIAESLHSLHRSNSSHRQTAPLYKSNKYTLTLKGFSPREIRHLEKKIVNLDSTKDLSSLASRDNQSKFWLQRQKHSPDVRVDLSTVLSKLNLQARIIQTSDRITLIKLSRDMAYLD